MNMQTRREFLKTGAALAAAGAMPGILQAAPAPQRLVRPSASGHNVLVVVELTGGNDGINTVIPCGDPRYYDLRPNLAVAENNVLQINRELGLHPSMSALKALYDEGRVAIIQGVGYPDPNRSHFRSMDIWHTAEPVEIIDSGWLGRLVAQLDPEGDEALTAINFGQGVSKAFHRNGVVVPSVTQIDNYGAFSNVRNAATRERANKLFERLYDKPEMMDAPAAHVKETGAEAILVAERLKQVAGDYTPSVTYPAQSPLAANLLQTARLHVNAGLSHVFYVNIGGFDSHANQLATHPNLVGQFSDAVVAFYRDLKAANRSSNVLIMAFSEFGRRAQENGSGGTDHGAAGPMFIIGDAVQGGLYGEHHPSLTDLDRGDLKYAYDFRSVYSTVIDNWLKLDPEQVLGHDFPRIAFV